MNENLLDRRSNTSHYLNQAYWGCVRPVLVDYFTLLYKEISSNRNTQFNLEIIKHYKNLKRTGRLRFSKKLKEIVSNKLISYVRKHVKVYKQFNFDIKICSKQKKIFITPLKDPQFTICLSGKEEPATGLTELFIDDYNTNNNTQVITFTNPGIEILLNTFSQYKKTLLNSFRDTLYTFDSIFLHELQHAVEDSSFLINNKTRTDDYYYKTLRNNSDYFYKKYVQHPAELLANIVQIVYYLNYIRPCGVIDAYRFYNFFRKLRSTRYMCSFKKAELKKFQLLLNRDKSDSTRWYRFIFKLINFKFYAMYRRSILVNISECLKKLTIK